MTNIFQTPGQILTGAGCFNEVGNYVSRLGKICLIVTGKGAMRKLGVIDRAEKILKDKGVEVAVFEGVEHDPSLATVDDARRALSENKCDVVLGIGGGSAIDVAKAAAGLANCPEATIEFFDGKEIPGGGLPVIAAPGTFGTGTEATRVSVLSDPARTLKKSIRHDCMLPKVAIVDPELGAGAPPRLTAACGMDALTQAIESFMSIHATPLTRPVSAGAAKLLAEYLPRSVADGSDLHAREMCATGSLMAGIALHNARLGLVHGIAHPLGAHYGMAHGEACGILLPHVLWFNRETAEEDYGQISDIIGADAADCCLQMLDKFSLPLDLKHLNIDEEGIETLIAETLPSGSTKSNPRPVDRKNLLEFLRGIC